MKDSYFHIELLMLISRDRAGESTAALRSRRWRDSGSTKRSRMQFQSSCSLLQRTGGEFFKLVKFCLVVAAKYGRGSDVLEKSD